MSDDHLQELQAALAASPDNLALRFIILRLLLETDDLDQTRRTVAGLSPDAVSEASQRLLIAEVWHRLGEPKRALEFLSDSEEPAGLLRRARVLADLERFDEARHDYERAVAADIALEDPELKRRLNVRIQAFPGKAGRPTLRVISNDDTDADDMLRMIEPEAEPVNFEHVGGLSEVKKTIHRKIILPFQKPGLFQRFKKRVGGGILLYGPPGCGKTLLARATAGEVDARFFNVAISDVLDMYIGESERKLHAIFEKARQDAPSVLFFDEVEALGGKRQYSREGTSAKVVSQFLSELDGFSRDNGGVLVLGATNVPWAIDPAFRRPGRFDRILFVPPPDQEARRAILDILLSERPREDRLDIDQIVRRTSGFSGADLRELVETAADEAIEASIAEEREIPISNTYLREALGVRRATTLEWLTTARNYARYANEGGQYDEVLAFLDKHGGR